MTRPPTTAAASLARWCARLCALTVALATAPAAAQTLPDPTRPPPEAASAAQGETPAAPVPDGPQLQSVLTGEHGREVAVIDGKTVRVGEKIDGALLVRVGKNEAVLQRGATRVVLHLFPPDEADGKQPGAIQRQR